MTTILLRRTSADHNGKMVHTTVPVKTNLEDMRDHLKNLGPSNPASNPKSTRVSAVKIKPGPNAHSPAQPPSIPTGAVQEDLNNRVDERTGLLRPQLTVKDGAQALHHSQYGSAFASPARGDWQNPSINTVDGPQAPGRGSDTPRTRQSTSSEGTSSPTDGEVEAILRRRGHVRSGSITENIVEAGGVRKVVLEANSSSESEGENNSAPSTPSEANKSLTDKKKNRRRTRKGGS